MIEWEKRFWEKVEKRGPDECWSWKGAISKNGYGSFKLGGKAQTSSRVAWLASYGRPAGDNMVLHKCDNRPCCNPAHLYLGDVAQNSRDMVERGRHRAGPVQGSDNGNAKLTERDVEAIMGWLKAGLTNKAIAAEFGVTHQMISKIRRGHMWKHVQNGKGEAA